MLLYLEGMTARDIIEYLDLSPLPIEGGYFRRTYYKSNPSNRGASASAIFYLLTQGTCSLLHRLPKDEIYHFYLGDPVELLMLDAHKATRYLLGEDILAGQRVQLVVSAGSWQGSRLLGDGQFALMGTTMCPAYSDQDLEMARSDNFNALQYGSELQELIQALTLE